MKYTVGFIVVLILIISGFMVWRFMPDSQIAQTATVAGETVSKTLTEQVVPKHPMSVEAMREVSYPGSQFSEIQKLPPGSNYTRKLVSYQSDGLKIQGLLTVPTGQMPEGGWPAIVFNHGYIPPEVYRPTERYIAYVDMLARSGFVIFRPDYRGHADSEGTPEGAYFAPGYTVDVLNAFSSLQQMKEVNPKRIGLWGHSLGGFITQKAIVIEPEIKASVVWGGVVGTYADMYEYWWGRRDNPSAQSGLTNWTPSQREQSARRSSRQQFVEQYGQPKDGSDFWKEISAPTYFSAVTGPVQIHHGLSDETVPFELSQQMNKYLKEAGKSSELFEYKGGDHDISDPNFTVAMNRTIEFFRKNL
jgi:dipeptidyl aminopeptidase/acylaminoacyl peptidase